jgi:hypothetical protein
LPHCSHFPFPFPPFLLHLSFHLFLHFLVLLSSFLSFYFPPFILGLCFFWFVGICIIGEEPRVSLSTEHILTPVGPCSFSLSPSPMHTPWSASHSPPLHPLVPQAWWSRQPSDSFLSLGHADGTRSFQHLWELL